MPHTSKERLARHGRPDAILLACRSQHPLKSRRAVTSLASSPDSDHHLSTPASEPLFCRVKGSGAGGGSACPKVSMKSMKGALSLHMTSNVTVHECVLSCMVRVHCDGTQQALCALGCSLRLQACERAWFRQHLHFQKVQKASAACAVS